MKRRRGLTLIELLVVMLIVAVIGAFLLLVPRGAMSGREVSPRLVCAANLKGIGTSMKLYANDNYETWAIPAFDESAVGSIRYAMPVGGGKGTDWSPSRGQQSRSGEGGATELSVARAFWMLVRSGDVTVNQFICPPSDDDPDPTDKLEAYYDFAGIEHISYGYQVPFGPKHTRPREGVDDRMALAADKGPYADASVAIPGISMTPDSARESWQPFNSPNHGGEGQNVLYADGHVTFEKTPVIGVDGDNIYTIALDDVNPASRFIGESPWKRSAHPFAPASGASSTDSVIFP